MDRFWGVLRVVLPVIAVVLGGAGIRRKKLITAEGMGQIKALLVNICLPAVLFRTFYVMVFTWKEAVLFFAMSGVTLGAFLLGYLLRRLTRSREGLYPWLCTTIEGGSIGYALYILLFGQENLYHLALLDAGNALLQWAVVMTLLSLRCKGKRSSRETLRSVVTPINAAILLGLLCSVTGLGSRISASGFGSALEATLDFVGTPVSALIMMAVGFDLSFRAIEWKETLKAILGRALIFAFFCVLVCLLLSRVFPGDALYRGAALIFFILPPTFVYSVYTRDSHESAFLGGFLAVYTLLTIAAFVVIAAVVG